MKVYSQKWIAATLAMVIAGTNVVPVLAKGTMATTNNKTTMSQNAANAKAGNHNSKFPNFILRKAILMDVLDKTETDATAEYIITDTDFGKIQTFTAKTGGASGLTVNNLTGANPLTGLEHMTALTKLSLLEPKITALDLSANVALTHLVVGDYSPAVSKIPLATMNLSKNISLTNLSLNSLSLTTLDISKNTALTDLVVSHSPFTALDLSKNVSLTKAHVFDNPNLAQLDVSKNVLLTNLRTSGNALKTLDLSTNTALTQHDPGTTDTNRIQTPTMEKDAETDGTFVVSLADIVGSTNLSKATLTGTPTGSGTVDTTNKTITWTAAQKGTKPTFEYTYTAGGPTTVTTKNDIKVRMTVDLKEPAPTAHVITQGSLTGGAITINPASATSGATVTLTVTPETGKQLKTGSLKHKKTSDSSASTAITTKDGANYTFTMPNYPVTIDAEFENIPATGHTITLPTIPTEQGAVTSDMATAAENAKVTLTVAPKAGYQLKAGTLKYTKDNVDTDITTVEDATAGTYSFVMPAGNVTIKAEFEPVSYAITVGAMTNGTVEVKTPTAQEGTVVQVTVKPEVGYVLQKGSLKAGQVALKPVKGGTWADFEFTMPKDAVTLSASFDVSPQFPIVVEKPKLPAGETPKGDVTLSNPTAKAGETVQLMVAPVAGYQLKADTLIVNGKVLNPSAAALAKMKTVEEFAPMVQTPLMGRAPQAFSFIMPPSEVSISAEFEVIPATAPPVTPPTPDTAPPVAPPVVVPTSPNTGDVSGVAGFMAMAMVSAAGLLGLKKRKAKN